MSQYPVTINQNYDGCIPWVAGFARQEDDIGPGENRFRRQIMLTAEGAIAMHPNWLALRIWRSQQKWKRVDKVKCKHTFVIQLL